MRRIYIFLLVTLTAFIVSAQEKDSEAKGFTWGGDVGTTIDFSSNGMSTIDADVNLGYKNSFFRSLCVGAGLHNTLSNGDRLVPVYLLVRTSFTSKPKQLCFGEFKLGYSFNSIKNENQHGLYASAGAGFNLYSNKKFKSHITIAYNFYKMKAFEDLKDLKNIHSVAIKVGINF